MKVATLQFDPRIGDLNGNIACADALLAATDLNDIQLLVGPELAFSGYNFPSLQAISDFLEPTCGGPTAWWAAKTARKFGLVVSIGYPEITRNPKRIPETIPLKPSSAAEFAVNEAKDYVETIKSTGDTNYWTFNSTLTVGPDGRVLAHYRKTHLYYTDVTWAFPSLDGFNTASIPFSMGFSTTTSFAICMDLNPKGFTANWRAYEVANHAVLNESSLLVVSTAWMSRSAAAQPNSLSTCCSEDVAEQPDEDTLLYWIERFIPLIKQDRETIVVVANRVGNEEGIVKACQLENLVKPVFEETSRAERISQQQGDHHDAEGPSLNGSPSTEEDALTAAVRARLQEEINTGIVSHSAHYAGTSTILVLGHGKASVIGVLGRGIQDVLVVDTEDKALMAFRIKAPEDEE